MESSQERKNKQYKGETKDFLMCYMKMNKKETEYIRNIKKGEKMTNY